ncbi:MULTISPECIES: LysR substrate-binding domain-containing protein [unclassified Streptomyces]|uniref:LysR substrate-binding domain-containing protein n=1 Tax=unclassified Streptomyces TaxID=2593676 RepID=UPI002E37D12D|nr:MULTISPECIES: LysR substrate-binding domain-containing protein [unclassified Streptomyces]
MLREANMQDLRASLLAGELDIILIPAVTAMPRFEHRVNDVEPIVVVSPDAGEGAPLELEQAGKERFILVPDTCGPTTFTTQLFQAHEVPLRTYPGEAAVVTCGRPPRPREEALARKRRRSRPPRSFRGMPLAPRPGQVDVMHDLSAGGRGDQPRAPGVRTHLRPDLGLRADRGTPWAGDGRTVTRVDGVAPGRSAVRGSRELGTAPGPPAFRR